MEPAFDRCVFLNCPFDDGYKAILQAMLFAIVYLGFFPRLATERTDAAESRLAKILKLIEGSKYSIHDLSRSQATVAGEHYRLNMPFELGIDYGCRRYFGRGREDKKILILEEKKYRHQIAISDLAGCDIDIHDGDYQKAVRKVRNWLANEAGIHAPGARKILDAYIDFQGWHYGEQLASGFSDEDIQDYPTKELLVSMSRWVELGKRL